MDIYLSIASPYTSRISHSNQLSTTSIGGILKKPSKATTPTDPQAEREAQKYDQPIASRELILSVMAERDVPMRFTELADALRIHNDSDLFSLQKRVKAMQRDGQLISGRRGALGLPKKMDLVKCKIIGHRDGYGFASPPKGVMTSSSQVDRCTACSMVMRC